MKNGLAIAGFVVSLCAAGLFAAALLCLMGVMLYPCIGLLFGGMAFSTAITGVALSGVGDHRSRRPEARGAGFAVAGLIVGTVALTLTLAVAALLIVLAAASCKMERFMRDARSIDKACLLSGGRLCQWAEFSGRL